MAKPRYAKLMGDAWRNPKLAKLSHEAFRLYVNCISYCADNLTDGLVPAHVMPALVPGAMPSALPVDELMAEPGLLLAVDGGYEVCNFLEHNVSRQDIEEHSERQRAKARKRWDVQKKERPVGGPPTPEDAASNAAGNAKYKHKNKHKNNSQHVWVVRVINEMHTSIFSTEWWGYAQYHTELAHFAEWASQYDEPEDAVRMACRGWAEDPYVIKQNFGPLPLLWRKAPQYYLAGVGGDQKSKQEKLEDLSRKEARAYKEGNSAESQRLQEAIARIQQG